MKKQLLTAILAFGMIQVSNGQAVTISPVNATGDQAITITLDANAACVPSGKASVTTASQVNLHSGVGTVADINDPLGKWTYVVAWDGTPAGGSTTSTTLTAGAAGIYTIVLTPRDFYGVPSGETIHRLSLVFNGNTTASPNWDQEAKDNDGAGGCADFFIELSTATSVADENLNRVSVKTYPNPVTENTTISFNTYEAADVKVLVYNILGQEVRTLVNKKMEAGNQFVSWNGKGEGDRELPNGQYFVQVSVDGKVATNKVVLNR